MNKRLTLVISYSKYFDVFLQLSILTFVLSLVNKGTGGRGSQANNDWRLCVYTESLILSAMLLRRSTNHILLPTFQFAKNLSGKRGLV